MRRLLATVAMVWIVEVLSVTGEKCGKMDARTLAHAMISINLTESDSFKIEQWCAYPLVYLDHWAWRRFSESPTLAGRLAKALKSQGGTLALSWLNMVEFAGMTGAIAVSQAREAEDLLDAIIPNIFFIEPDFFKVIEQEDKIIGGGPPTAPHADMGLVDCWAKLSLHSTASLKILTAGNMFRMAQASGITTNYGSFTTNSINSIEGLRRDYESNAEFRARVNRVPSGPQIQRGTRYLRNELVRHFLTIKDLKITPNHVVDLSHAIVGAAYCDYVLLDNHWRTQLEAAQKRIRAGGLTFPIAKCFSANGIEAFLQELESKVLVGSN
jgi:hypothetical protein